MRTIRSTNGPRRIGAPSRARKAARPENAICRRRRGEELTDAEDARHHREEARRHEEGPQLSAQPGDVAAKAKKHRYDRTKADLYAEAKKREIPGRSTMTRDQLVKALYC
ncbi:hypothetical protein AB5I41_05650 [Sphingomonas sp. MMS24-JH45]